MKLLHAIALVSLTLISGISQANPNLWNHHGYRSRSDCVAPFVIGGVVGYAITRNQPTVVIQNPPNVYYQPQPVPYGYHYENILDANCNCYRLVLVQNQP
jgi:hypothetical protein